jgi:hypothetical protein
MMDGLRKIALHSKSIAPRTRIHRDGEGKHGESALGVEDLISEKKA